MRIGVCVGGGGGKDGERETNVSFVQHVASGEYDNQVFVLQQGFCAQCHWTGPLSYIREGSLQRPYRKHVTATEKYLEYQEQSLHLDIGHVVCNCTKYIPISGIDFA